MPEDHDVDALVAEAIDAMRELYEEAGEDMPEVDEAKVRAAVEESLASDVETG